MLFNKLFNKKIKKSNKIKLTDEKTVTIGRLGEDVAVEFLKKNGYTVIERNFRASHNELDIIASDKKHIVFVEVKARTYNNPDSMRYGRPASAVTYGKRKRTLDAARQYMRTHPTKGKQPRIDVIEIFFTNTSVGEKEVYKINHIVNAFGA